MLALTQQILRAQRVSFLGSGLPGPAPPFPVPFQTTVPPFWSPLSLRSPHPIPGRGLAT